MHEGDAARLTDAGPLQLTADGDAEVIVWESDASGRCHVSRRRRRVAHRIESIAQRRRRVVGDEPAE